MSGKVNKNAVIGHESHGLEFVSYRVLAYLLGYPPDSIVNLKNDEIFQKIGFCYHGQVRKYSFSDAAKLAYPELTNYEIARLRVDINEKILEWRERNKAVKSRSKE